MPSDSFLHVAMGFAQARARGVRHQLPRQFHPGAGHDYILQIGQFLEEGLVQWSNLRENSVRLAATSKHVQHRVHQI